MEVVAGLLEDDQGRLLACCRPQGKHLAGKWEFPGGKIESGETASDALVRELREELGITVSVGRSLTPVHHDYGKGKVITLFPMCCSWLDGELEAKEHAEIRWCDSVELRSLDWAAADIPIMKEWCSGGTQ
ncbi:MAG: (deoxy)nucleoside triphosphate pyrophosphohydrolase [Verrucomicrobiales bacterium]